MANELRYESTETLLQTAAGVVSDICSKSTVFNKDHELRYPRFSDQEVVVGKVIGRGGFGVVRNVDKIKIHGGGGSSGGSVASAGSRSSSSCLPWLCGRSAVEEDFSGKGVVGGPGHAPSKLLEELSDSDERFTREYVAARSKRKTKHGTRYVLKKVSTDVSKITYMKGCVDIALEGKFLATLNDHPNIIQLVAVSKAKPCSQGYFLIIEKMSETLGGKIKKWMDMDRQNKSVISAITGGKRKELKLYCEQIASSYDIVNALHYLHSKNIIYRDLKPDNIGFDSYNVLKIFDFGLAKELRDEDKRDDGLYRNMTNCTGAVRYMAPEVGMNRPYNLSADVYSFSMLLWFILALEPPFGLYTNKMIFERVMKKGSRPAIFKKWNDRIADILRDSWDTDISQRPSFLEISLSLKQELIDCEANVLECRGGGDATSATAPSWHGSNNGCGCEEGNVFAGSN